VLICPKTKAHITINEAKGVAFADQTDVSYPIRDGIIDFIPEKRIAFPRRMILRQVSTTNT
jgi:uncharacterized protein YbaR (Trm112 family)